MRKTITIDTEHWLYQTNKPLTKREAFENMLLMASDKDTEIIYKSKVYQCNRGQIILSLNDWAKTFKWTREKVRAFFILLEKNKEITQFTTQPTTQSTTQLTTHLTICKYDIYNGSTTQLTTQPTTQPTTQLTTQQNDTENQQKKQPKPKPEKELLLNYTPPDPEDSAYKIAIAFFKLFRDYRMKKGISCKIIDTTTTQWIKDSQKLLKIASVNEIGEIYKYLFYEQDSTEPFKWIDTISSINAVTKHYDKLIIKSKNYKNGNQIYQTSKKGNGATWEELEQLLRTKLTGNNQQTTNGH